MLPSAPQAGRAAGLDFGSARAHTSIPTVSVLGSRILGTGVKKVRLWFTGSIPPDTPVWNEPPTFSGRHGPVSETAPHSEPSMLAVQGRPLLQFVVLLNCHPPMA